MTKEQQFSLSNRINSFKYALRGIILMLKSQHNAWLHGVATFAVIASGLLFSITANQWCWLTLAMVTVWSSEALNTALEFLADVTSSEFHPMVEKAKDVAAGSVLISAIGSVVIATIVLGPYFYNLFISLINAE